MVEIEPRHEPCRICRRDTNKDGACYCECQYDDAGELVHDCGQCSNGLVCLDCDDRFKGLELSISVFYG